ncbi:MAG: periplasmic heavy metal sensor [Betaproteobacteria bacterium]|nr:periplasmic heavy metal sensor [Betaproteobacteria bacterium]
MQGKSLNAGGANGAKRGGFLRRTGVVLMAAAAMSAAAWQAHAHGGPGFGGGFFGGGKHGAQSEARVDRMLQRFYSVTNATPEQQQRIAPIVKQAVSDVAPLREQMRGTREQARNIMSAPQIDRAALEQLRASRLQTADAVSQRMTRAFADVAEVLSPEQRKALAERMQQRGRHGQGERDGQRRQRW